MTEDYFGRYYHRRMGENKKLFLGLYRIIDLLENEKRMIMTEKTVNKFLFACAMTAIVSAILMLGTIAFSFAADITDIDRWSDTAAGAVGGILYVSWPVFIASLLGCSFFRMKKKSMAAEKKSDVPSRF